MSAEGANFAVVIPVTLTDGKASALGTAIKHEAIEGAEYTESNASNKVEYISSTMANGVSVEIPKVTKVLDGTTGAEKSGAGDAVNKMSFTTLEVDAAAMEELSGIKGENVITCIPLGFGSDGSSFGYAFMLGKLSGDITRAMKGNSTITVKVEFSATTLVADVAFTFTTLNSAFGIAVDPMGGTAITKIIDVANAFTAGELTALFAGEIVYKDAA
jgi:hypothetical protein